MSSFTVPIDNIAHAPYIEVKVVANGNEYIGLAIIDTGAAMSGITKKAVKALHLKRTGKHRVNTAKGKANVNYFVADIVLCNSVSFQNMFFDLFRSWKSGPDFLIGMDILSQGNFAITNYNNISLISFESPSRGNIDFSRL